MTSSEPGPAPESQAPLPRWTVLKLARYSVPFHAVLPMVMWLPEDIANTAFMVGFFVIHLGFPLVLAITYPWWQGRAGEVVALIILNHVVTFAGLGVLATL